MKDILLLILVIPSSPPQQPYTFSQMDLDRCLSATFRLFVDGECRGSGVLVGREPDGRYVGLIASHCRSGARYFSLHLYRAQNGVVECGDYVEQTVLISDRPCEDVAVIGFHYDGDLPMLRVLPPSKTGPDVGDEILSVGCSACNSPSIECSSVVASTHVQGLNGLFTLTDSPGAGGRSGGPLVWRDPNYGLYVVGTCYGRQGANRGLFTRPAALRRALDNAECTDRYLHPIRPAASEIIWAFISLVLGNGATISTLARRTRHV